MGVIAKGFPGVARVNKVTPVSLEYPLSVFNQNFTLTSNDLTFGSPGARNDSKYLS